MHPMIRPRRLRRGEAMRSLVRETRLHPSNFVYPLFVTPGEDVRHEISSMPGNYHWSVDRLVEEVSAAWDDGIRAVLLFGIPSKKDAEGSEAWADDAAVQRGVRAIRESCPEMLVMTDVCLCEYTDHGHCGVIVDGEIANDPTLDLLAKSAVSHARAGAHVVAPSDMMDGRVAAIRDALDGNGFEDVAILAYSAKYASAFYGPFREAADSAPQFGDRRGYQMDPPNAREAMREIALDLDEGADMIMVKPALAYLDVIRRARDTFDAPVAAYNVSGEFSMLRAAADRGWIDYERVMMETLTSIKRAGADIILTYHAREAARLIAAENGTRTDRESS